MRGDREKADGSMPVGAGRPIRVLLVEDDQSTTEAIVRDFGRSGLAVAVARTLDQARRVLRDRPVAFDVVILEIRLPDGRGESLLPDIEDCSRQPGVIISSSFLPELDPNALAYRPVAVSKPTSTTALLRIVKTVASGYTSQMIRRFVRRFDLSKREAETIGLLVQGHGAKEIAHQLDCSEKTVYYHLGRTCQKACCRDYHELIGRLFAFTCQALGHTPPEYRAFAVDMQSPSGRKKSVAGR